MSNYKTTNALHDGLFMGSLFVMLATAGGAYLGFPSVWVTPISGVVLWILAATMGGEKARGPP